MSRRALTSPSLSVVVLAYNEADNVAAVLGELRDWLAVHEPDAEIVFVDDGSSDATAERARDALVGFAHRLLRHERNRGIGAALKTATRAARAPWLTFLPADGQIDPAAIGTLREEAARSGADFVLSVYDHRDDGLHRTVLSWGVRALIRIVHGVRLESDGPYLLRRRLFDPGQLPPDSFFLNFELPLRALRAGLTIRTVTIACRPRRSGQSKSTGLHRVAGVAYDLGELRLRTLRETLARGIGRAAD